jgi:hypothetical protein
MVVLYGCSSKFVAAGEDGSAPSPEAATIPPPSPEDGAPPGADAGADAARPTTRCTRGAPFGAPELVAELSTAASEAAASLTEDELTVFFARNGSLMIATRASREQPFANVRSAGLSGSGTDDNPALSFDGRQLFFTSTARGDSGATEIFVAQVMGGGLTAPAPVRGVPPETTDPFPNGDASALYYSAARDGGLPDLWLATGLGGAPGFSEQRLTVSDTESDGQPVLSRDELSLYFGSRRAGTLGLSDIFVAKRARTSDPFTNAVSRRPHREQRRERPAALRVDRRLRPLLLERSPGRRRRTRHLPQHPRALTRAGRCKMHGTYFRPASLGYRPYLQLLLVSRVHSFGPSLAHFLKASWFGHT